MQHLNARRANLDFLPATSGHNRDLDLDRPNEAAIWIIERILNLMSGYYERWILKQSFPFRYAATGNFDSRILCLLGSNLFAFVEIILLTPDSFH